MLELLAPARTADIGIEAIRHGADAVYIGAPHFGARQAAGNSLADIRRLVDYAHQFGARIYVTVNTIVYDNELESLRQLVNALYEAKVDALIVQDMSLRRLDLPPIPLHASTQMDNRTADKVGFLEQEGFEQVVLARELSLDEIREIHHLHPDVKLEVFVHGALCVSYSGQCYASEAICGRSANRGACAQVCRMEFDLEDGKGTKLVRGGHMLSLRDLCQLDALENLAEAGASSFKIEGRLKSMDYVKNVTAAYSQALDRLVARFPDRYRRASRGHVELKFEPNVYKSFNRGFTHYFLYGRTPDIFSLGTPKALGEVVGRVKRVFTDGLSVDSNCTFSNGDGICFFDRSGRFHGFRVNRAEGQRLFVTRQSSPLMDLLERGTTIYRNSDKAFEALLERPSAERFLPVDITIEAEERPDGSGVKFHLSMSDGEMSVETDQMFAAELARTHQRQNIERQMGRLGTTRYRLCNLDIRYRKNYFIPSSLLGEWRKILVAELEAQSAKAFSTAWDAKRQGVHASSGSSAREGMEKRPLQSWPPRELTYLGNVSNRQARQFYASCGTAVVQPAFELVHRPDVPLMFCRHCIRYAMGWCVKHPSDEVRRSGKSLTPPRELYLALANGTRFRLEFDCRNCQMLVYLAQNGML